MLLEFRIKLKLVGQLQQAEDKTGPAIEETTSEQVNVKE